MCTAQAAVGYAVTRRTPADLKRMRVALTEMQASEGWPTLRRGQVTFHLALADACANPWIGNSIREAMASVFLPLSLGDVRQARQSTVVTHEELHQALTRRDGAKALDKLTIILNDRWDVLRAAMREKGH